MALRLTEGLGPLPEPAFGWLSVSGNDGRWTESATGERAFDAEQMRAYAGAAVAAERERWHKHLRDLAAGHQRAADMADNSTVAQHHDAMAAALLAAIEWPNVGGEA